MVLGRRHSTLPQGGLLGKPARGRRPGVSRRDGSTLDALPDGLLSVGHVFDATVLLCRRTLGDFDPSTAEWVVSIQSGWLE